MTRNQSPTDRSLTILPHFRAVLPKPLSKPQLAADFLRLDTMPRALESIRYGIHRLEYSLSPGGALRFAGRLSLSLLAFTLVIGVPLGIALAIAIAVLSRVDIALAYVISILLKTIAIMGILIGLVVIYRIWRYYRSGPKNHRKDGSSDQDYFYYD